MSPQERKRKREVTHAHPQASTQSAGSTAVVQMVEPDVPPFAACAGVTIAAARSAAAAASKCHDDLMVPRVNAV
jgi:hypothetical protein